jgi:hypothetical protein
MKSMILLISNQYFPSSGARPVLLMGVAPRDYSQKFFEYRLKDIAFSSFQLLLLAFISSGAWPALPMGVAPKAIRGCLQPFIDSNIFFTHLFFSF